MKKIYKNILYNLLIALLISLLFITTEQIYRIYNDILMFNLNAKTFAEYLIINFLILSLTSKRAIIATYSLLITFIWFQYMHFAYFGTWIFPLEYYLFFTKFQETFDTFKTVATIGITPTILMGIVTLGTYFIIKNLKDTKLNIPYLGIILIIFLISMPVKVFIKDSKKGARPNVEYYPIKNSITTLSYLLGNIMPKKLSGHSGLEQTIVNTPKLINKNPDINVVMIMGESLHREYMSLYGYKIKTTPFLDTLKDSPDFLYKRCISDGVVTDVSIPSFFNMIKKPDGVPQIISTNTCLFKMASNNGFTTHFYSAQAQDQLAQLKSYLCPKYIDNYIDGTAETKDVDTPALDRFLLGTIDKIDFSKSNFIVLHQRGSHTPFKIDYPPEFEIFTKENTADKSILQNTLEYQNSIIYTDHILSEIIKKIKSKTTKPTYFVFTSDHATNIGDTNRNGHGRLDYDSVYQVPFFVYTINGAKSIKDKFSEFDYISHYQASKTLSYLLGYENKYEKFNQKENYFVCDSDISGLAGILKLSFDENDKQIPKILK
ncbi:MAG: sulfatase-like hydrolase/transferase [Sulfurimonas sp.]|nr:sulfatase-like hydrolase/transferase [Sulfurimonas sp.]